MRLTSRAWLVVGLAALGVAAWLAVRARTTGEVGLVTDLVAELAGAERRPPNGNFDVTPVTIGGETHSAISTPAASRITWELPLPDRAVVRVAVALRPEAWTVEGDGVLFRIGVAEGRTHEDVLTRLVNPFGRPDDRRWVPLVVDLGAYSGFKWSLFYQPRTLVWRLVFNTNAGLPGSQDSRGDLPLWGAPAILGVRPGTDSRPR